MKKFILIALLTLPVSSVNAAVINVPSNQAESGQAGGSDASESFYICGDANGDGSLNLGDLIYLIGYLFDSDPEPPVMEAADMDGCLGLDISDPVYLTDYFFWEGPLPNCNVVPCTLDVSGSITLDHTDGLYAPDNILSGRLITFFLRITGDNYHRQGMTNGFRIYSPDGAQWNSTTGAYTNYDYWDQLFDAHVINGFSISGNGADTIGYGNYAMVGGLPNYFDEIVYQITIGPIDTIYHGKTIILDSCFFPPSNTWKWAAYTEVIPDWGGLYSFTIIRCCVNIRGNIDGDPLDQINIADLVYFVDYSFGTPPGPPPPCPSEADVDGSGGLNIADLVYLVDYMFNQPPGPAPVDCP